ncbi:thiamine phosphate synthase [Nocardioides sp. AE5]|uniref:thiamine phosphate synthase n=1 Tax=Nocardioides sp. AE5 TaxID=2962573 RepID=UPI0028820C3B|nr:thiamine phosphate synthase [Nocardioides sp. AE5]MDT0202216.1 thiamine phosphate synthase [Nocardioides sp. AE5]
MLPDLRAAGVDGFQVRAKGATTAAMLELTARALEAGATVVVNDRLDVALAAGAHGVHLGADDLPVAAARRIAGDLLIGATCRDVDDVRRAARAGADYAGFGPLFATTSKAGLPAPLGVAPLTDAAGDLPLVGIGGIDAARAAAVIGAGAHGVAVIGGIWRQPDPVQAAKELVQALG